MGDFEQSKIPQEILAGLKFPNQKKHLLENNWCQTFKEGFIINVTLNGTFNCPKSKKSSLARDFLITINFTKLVLLVSNALSMQIYGDKFLFQNIYSAGSKGFFGHFELSKIPK